MKAFAILAICLCGFTAVVLGDDEGEVSTTASTGFTDVDDKPLHQKILNGSREIVAVLKKCCPKKNDRAAATTEDPESPQSHEEILANLNGALQVLKHDCNLKYVEQTTTESTKYDVQGVHRDILAAAIEVRVSLQQQCPGSEDRLKINWASLEKHERMLFNIDESLDILHHKCGWSLQSCSANDQDRHARGRHHHAKHHTSNV